MGGRRVGNLWLTIAIGESVGVLECGARGEAGEEAPLEPTEEVREEVIEATVSELGWSLEY